MQINVEIPEKLLFLLTERARYKVARGGRGSGKSWSFARALLTLGASRPIRVLCAREVQKSIKDSVHKLLKDQIGHLGMGTFYNVLDAEIRGANGTEFSFTGLSSHTAHTIKSFEGVDYCWVEEGQTISKKSWDILLPTIRKDGSEIWVSYNPELETDETHQRFTVNQPDNCINVLINWSDNPWFNEIQRAEQEGRICAVPYNPLLKVHVVFDLGKGDSLFVSMVQKHMSAIMVIDCIAGTHFNLNSLSVDLRTRPYNWGKMFLPHDGFTTTINAPRSTAETMRALGWDVVPREVIKLHALSVEEGIRNARTVFPQTYFDRDRAAPLIESLKRYRRHINQATGAASDPVHDDASHGADNYRYIGCNADLMTNDNDSDWDEFEEFRNEGGRNAVGGY
jgi:phage terminase large subunit